MIYKEASRGNHGEGSVAFTAMAARGGGTFIMEMVDPDNPTIEELGTALVDLVGAVDISLYGPGPGRSNPLFITRRLPRRHPFSETLIVVGATARGVGKYAPADERPDPNIPVIEGYPIYPCYEIEVEFGTFLGNVLPDSSITTGESEYINYKGDTVAFKYAREWLRNVTRTEIPTGEVLTGKFGQFVIETSDNLAPGGPMTAGGGGAAQWTGNPFQQMPDAVVKFLWEGVPDTYLTSPNSYLRNCPVGVINQFDFYSPIPGAPEMYPSGTLRYGGYTYTQYVPPIHSGVDILLDERKLVNIEITCHSTTRDRFAERVPDRPPGINKNWLYNGWNLVPNLMYPNQYFYCHTYKGEAKEDRSNIAFWQPAYNSFPFELFWTNPDADQPDRDHMLEVRQIQGNRLVGGG
jgi:hypothetical protein